MASKKISVTCLIFLVASLRSEETDFTCDVDSAPVRHEKNQAEHDAEELVRQGDIQALAGEIEEALSLWGEAYHLGKDQASLERLTWACFNDAGRGWEQKNAGRDFARHMRDSFLGSVPAIRQAIVRGYCQDPENKSSHAEIAAFIEWLSVMLPKDRNLELLPLIMDDGLGKDRRMLSNVVSIIINPQFMDDAPRAFKAMSILGFLGKSDNFSPLRISDDGKDTLMERMVSCLSRIKKYQFLSVYTPLKNQLLEVKPRTLGVDLILVLTDSDDVGALASFLTRHTVEIGVMKPDRRKDLIDMLKLNLEGYPNTENMTDAMVAALRPLLPKGELKTIKLEDLLAEALSPETLTKDEKGKWPVIESAAELLINAAQNHSERAADGLRKTLAVLQKYPEQNDPKLFPWEKPDAHLLLRLHEDSYTFSMALKASTERGILNHPDSSDRVYRCIKGYFANKSGNFAYGKLSDREVTDYFFSGDSVFLGDAGTFQPVGTILSNIVDLICTDESTNGLKMKNGVIEILHKRKPQTFGLEMINVMLSKDKDRTVNFIRRRASDLVKIPSERRPSVLGALCAAWNALEKPEKLEPEIQKLISPLLIPEATEMEVQYQRYVAAESLLMLGQSPETCIRNALPIVDFFARTNMKKAMELVHAVGRIILAGPLRNYEDNHGHYEEWYLLTATIPELYGPVLREKASMGHPMTADQMELIQQRIKQSYVLPKNAGFFDHLEPIIVYEVPPERLVKFLESGCFLEDAATFRSYCYDDTRSFLQTMVGSFGENADTRRFLAEYLEKGKSTFGVDLAKALLEKKPDGIFNFMSKRGAELVNMPHDNQHEIARLCGIRYGGWLELADASTEWKIILQPILQGHRANIENKCDSLLAASNINDAVPQLSEAHMLDFHKNVFNEPLAIISEMMLIDPEKGSRVFRHFLKLALDADIHDEKKWHYAEHFLGWSSYFPPLIRPCVTAFNELGDTIAYPDIFWSAVLSHMTTSPIELFCLMNSAGYMSDAEKWDVALSRPLPEWLVQGQENKPPPTLAIPRRNLLYYGLIIYLTQSGCRNERTDFHAHLSKRHPRTFGIDLMQAVLDDQPSKAIQDFYKTHLDGLAKLPKASREPIEVLLRCAWPDMPRLPEARTP